MAVKESTKRKSSRQRAKPNRRPPFSKITSEPFSIVGIGASAGGLKAYEELFANMPADSGAGFVLIPHLDPNHVSMLPELLKKYTEMAIVQAEDSMKVEPNRVHVIPPNNAMTIARGMLRLERLKEPRRLRLPIDTFFTSLAADRGARAVGIILSGNGTDGTLGLEAIKAHSGMAMAQEPASAEYGGMPSSAVETGLVDYVLPPEKLARQLMDYLKGTVSRPAFTGEKNSEPLQRIFQLLHARTDHDFSLYKKNAIERRIERRMDLHQLDNMAHYASYLARRPQECDVLFKQLLIGVTGFFRDREAFEELRGDVLPHLLADRAKGEPVRVWVAGCSSGEEVYSIAMVLRECMDKLKKNFALQIFGSDIDADALALARAGLYPASIAADVGPNRLKRFFTAEGNGFRISKELRQAAIFALHDVLKDPPFIKLDLLSCRNLLIYLDAEAQKKLLPVFHYAIKSGGILFLGSSESIDRHADLFSPIDKKSKLFKRRPSAAAAALVQFPSARPQLKRGMLMSVTPNQPARKTPLSEVTQKLLARVANAAPPCVFIDTRDEIFFAHGKTGKYLEIAQGHAHLNVLEMARQEIRHPLAIAIRKARAQAQRITGGAVRLKVNGGNQKIALTVAPVTEVGDKGELLMVTFEDIADKPVKVGRGRKVFSATAGQRIAQLEQELNYGRQDLQASIDELQNSNAELKSSNEELQSTNEELQSANEELETSKEEMQSLNEELVSINAELHEKFAELAEANDDMRNFLDSTSIATVFLDRQLLIKRFTAAASSIVNLIPSDVGRPFHHIASKLEEDNLYADAAQVLDSLVAKERQVRSTDGRWYLCRTIPYRTQDNQIDGVVMTLTDMTELKLAESAAAAKNLAEGIIDTVREPLVALDGEFRVIAANGAFYRLFQAEFGTTIAHSFFELGNRQWDIPALRELLEKVLPQNSQVDNFLVESDFPKIGRKKMIVNARRIFRAGVGTETILLAINEAIPNY
jgi:two-component system CheB/CheR fusion protein